jgi:glycosyltransferase involved in cell wall biosynthesis
MALPDWAHNIQTDWYSYVKNVLTKADICVIPYPSDKLHFAYTLPAKLADYMAAGKPIVATDALETALVITKYDCGLIAKDWVDFSRKIEKLCCSPNLALKLGEHGRKAAEDFLNYEILAKTYLKKVLGNFNYVGY